MTVCSNELSSLIIGGKSFCRGTLTKLGWPHCPLGILFAFTIPFTFTVPNFHFYSFLTSLSLFITELHQGGLHRKRGSGGRMRRGPLRPSCSKQASCKKKVVASKHVAKKVVASKHVAKKNL